MNFQSIWPGDLYAWSYQRPKGIFPRNGRKVTVKDKRKVRYFGNERMSAEALIEVDNGSELKWVPAREIVDFWDNYESELEHVKEEARLRNERYEQEREQRRKEREERIRLEEEAKDERYATFATLTGLPRGTFEFMGTDRVLVDIAALEKRLEM